MELLKPLYTSWATPILLFAIAYACVYLPHREKELQEACSLYDYEHYVLYSRRVVTPKGIIPAAIEVMHGRIASVIKRQEAPVTSEKLPVIDYGSLVISPGLVDIHVHLNEPGRTEWEGFVSGTRAAAAGGITTLVDMPLNSIPTTINKEALLLKLVAAKGKLAVDVGFWGGLVTENALEPAVLDDLLKEGALGLKSFMCPSGINDFPDTNATHFEVALPILAKYGRPLLVHGELVLPIVNGDHDQQEEDPHDYFTYLRSRPPSWQALHASQKHGC